MTVPMTSAADVVDYQAGNADLLAAAADALVRGYCGWHVAPSLTETLTVDGSGGCVQPLPTRYLTAVASVTDDGLAVNLADEDVEWSTSGLLWRYAPWTWRPRGVVATITHGYPVVPADVQMVAADLAGSLADAPGLVTRMTVGQVSREFAAERLGGLHQSVLDRYRITAIA